MNGVKVQEYLLKHTEVGEVIVFNNAGYDIGMTVIDNEDLFITSISLTIQRKPISNVSHEKRKWAVNPVTVLHV